MKSIMFFLYVKCLLSIPESNLWGKKKCFYIMLFVFDLWGALDFKHVLIGIQKRTGGSKKIIDDILI